MKSIYLIFVLLTTTCASSGHSGDSNSPEELLRQGKDIYFENTTFEEAINLTELLQANKIGRATSQITINSSITFINCKFEGEVTAFAKIDDGTVILSLFKSNLSFVNCSFEKSVSFRASSILGRANFSNSFFNETVSFEECTFFQNANFTNCSFLEEVRFQNAFFMQKVNFMRAGFDKTVFFQGVTFNSEAQFSVAKFIGYADFSLVSCRQNLIMNYAEFADQSIFNNSYFYGRTDFLKVKFTVCEFKKCHFNGEVRFDDSSAEKSISFENSSFLPNKPDLSWFENIDN